jgi:hypothetical protein
MTKNQPPRRRWSKPETVTPPERVIVKKPRILVMSEASLDILLRHGKARTDDAGDVWLGGSRVVVERPIPRHADARD